jgi:hypothetical protein
MALNIAGHLLRGRVTALGLLAHRHAHDIVQIAPQNPLQTIGIDVPGVCEGVGCRRIDRADGIAAQRRIFFTDRALYVVEAHGRNEEGTDARQQFIEQHPQHVDIARGGDDLTSDLFRARMIRRHDADVCVGEGQRVMRRLALAE